MTSLRTWNMVAAILHWISAGAMWWLYDGGSFDLYILRLDPVEMGETVVLEEHIDVLDTQIEVGLLLVLFLVMSAVAHTLIATVFYDRYRSYIREGINPYRWWEYAFSASTMIVAIAVLSGLGSVGLLLSLFALTALMNLMGLVMERRNDVTSGDLVRYVDWRPYWYGVFAGIIPWIAIGLSLIRTRMQYPDEFPDFVLLSSGATFVLFNVFALNMWLQYREIGPWTEYLWGEKMYIVLSLVSKSLLAWWVYLGAQNAPGVTV